MATKTISFELDASVRLWAEMIGDSDILIAARKRKTHRLDIKRSGSLPGKLLPKAEGSISAAAS